MARFITRPVLEAPALSDLMTALTVPGEDGSPRRLRLMLGAIIDYDPTREQNRNNADRADWFAKLPDEVEVEIESVARSKPHGTLWRIEGNVFGKKRYPGDHDRRAFKGHINTTSLEGTLAIHLPF